MPLFDLAKIYRDRLQPLLADGEEPLVAERVVLAYGTDRVERTPEERFDKAMRGAPRVVREQAKAQLRRTGSMDPKDRSTSNTLVNVLLLDFDIPWPWRNVDWKKIFGGVIVTGGRGSYADRLSTPIETAKLSLLCVVTDRRLLLVKHEALVFTHVFDMPRQAIVSARRRSRGLSRSRVALEFTDSSSIMLHAGRINAGGAANRLVRAFTGVA